jgi:hypothetical protein
MISRALWTIKELLEVLNGFPEDSTVEIINDEGLRGMTFGVEFDSRYKTARIDCREGY